MAPTARLPVPYSASLPCQTEIVYRIVDGLLRVPKYDVAIRLTRTYLQSFTEKRFAVQLALMKVWMARKQSCDVLRLLDTIDTESLSPAEQQQLE